MSNKLALTGGKKTIDHAFSCAAPIVPPKAYESIKALLDKGEISLSPTVQAFEKRFSEYIGTSYGLCLVNGTTSIQAALFALGVRMGDEVIVPSFTFWATVGPVVACGGVPVFADCDLDTHNITAEAIEMRITKKTKAILLVHVWGNPCDMESIIAVAKKHNLRVIEDCSHAHGAEYNGKKVGSFGDIGCFSLQGSKILPAGEGGILVTDNKEYYEAAISYGHYERIAGLGEESPNYKYRITGFGFKHRAHPLGIAIADAGLDILDELNTVRSENALMLEKGIADIKFIVPQRVLKDSKRAFSYHYARYDSKKANGISLYTVLKALSAEGLYVGSCGYGKLHLQPLFATSPYAEGGPYYSPALGIDYISTPPGELINSERLGDGAFMLAPRFEKRCPEEVALYIEAYRKVAENLDELSGYERANNLAGQKIVNKGTSINIFK